MPCYSPLKGWKNRDTGGIVFRADNCTEKMEVACGSCLGCRLDRSRIWAIRIVHESMLHDSNCFITLTYDDASVPKDWSLNRKHFVDFMKRLRKVFAPDFIRYYMAGEYGNHCRHGIDLLLVGCPLCHLGRPHFHACLFNCSFLDVVPYGSRDGDLRYTSDVLSSVWSYGFVDVGVLNFESAAYVARYILKKVDGLKAPDWYYSVDLDGVVTFLEPEYSTMSRGGICTVCRKRSCKNAPGGIGKLWFDEFKSDVFPSDEVPVPGSGVFKCVPRYYEEIFKCTDALSLADIKAARQAFMREHADDFTPERLMDKYKVKMAQVSSLTRSL